MRSLRHSGRCHRAILRNCGAQFRSKGYPPEPEALVERPFQNWSDPDESRSHKDFLSRQKQAMGGNSSIIGWALEGVKGGSWCNANHHQMG